MTIEESKLNNNIKFCECGCGQPVTYNKYRPARFFKGHHAKGSNNPKWDGGRKLSYGYVMIWKPDHPYCNTIGYVYEHRLVMESYLGRYLDRKEVIHHINRNKQDNRIENLMLFENDSKHKKYEKLKYMSNRICSICKSDKTYTNKRLGYINWYNFKDGFICGKCYQMNRRNNYLL